MGRNGGATRTRTWDTRLFKPLLYQLSYSATVPQKDFCILLDYPWKLKRFYLPVKRLSPQAITMVAGVE